VALFLASGVVPASPASSQSSTQFQADASVLVADNPLLLPRGGGAVVVTEISATPRKSFDLEPGGSIAVEGTAMGRFYGGGLGRFFLGDVKASGNYRDSERLTLQGQVEARRDLSIDLLTSSVGAAADPASIQTSYRGRFEASVHPDEYTSMLASVSTRDEHYSRTTLLRGVTETIFGLSASRRTSARTSLGLVGSAALSHTAGEGNVTTLSLRGSWSQQLTQSWRSSVEFGAEKTGDNIVRLDTATVRQPGRTLASARGQLCRDGQHATGCLELSLSSERSALGRLERRLALSTTAGWTLSPRTTLRLRGGYDRSSVPGTMLRTLKSLDLSGMLERRVGRALTLAVRAEYRRRGAFDGQRDSFLGGLQLRYATDGL
jgi:hypothetical protein